ncbi:MAG: arginase family protein [Phycisphaerales bacterium]|nr:arginase family protein [Phycisphaerales bacterium]
MPESPTQPGSLTQERHVRVVGVPMDIGGAGRGAAGGPAAVRATGLMKTLGPGNFDLGDIEVESLPDSLSIVHGPDPHSTRPEWPLIQRVCTSLRERVESIVTEGHFPLVVGGDHALAVGSMAGVARSFHKTGRPTPGLIWFDAHGDLNTPETSPSGNPHGMPAAALLGFGVPPFDEVIGPHGYFDGARTAFVGCRDLDDGEKTRFNDSGPHLFGGDRFRNERPEDLADRVLDLVAPNGAPFALSFDIDVLDPVHAPGVNLRVNDGLDPDTVRRVLRRFADHGGMIAMDVVEVDPTSDRDGVTAGLAVELTGVALGTSIVSA